MQEADTADDDLDGTPYVYQRPGERPPEHA
jgi:hypothetical protein